MSNWGNMLINAVDNIGKYFGVTSRAEFMYKLLTNDTDIEGTTVQTSGQFAMNLLDSIDGAAYGLELVQWGRSQTSEEPKDLFADISDDDKAYLKDSFMIVGNTGATNPAELLGPQNDMTVFCGNQWDVEKMSHDAFPTKAKPGLLLINVESPSLNYANRDTGAVGIFLNGIPTLELSRAIPFVNIMVIEQNPPTDSLGRPQGISLIRFLQGTEVPPDKSSWQSMANSAPADMYVPPPQPETPDPPVVPAPPPPEVTKPPFSAAGMEIFTSPQTLVPAGELYRSYDEMGASMQSDSPPDVPAFPGAPGSHRPAPVIDRMRPFMTLKSVEIAIKPTRGPMSIKTCKIAITLHDRSRLAEIGGLVAPAAWGGTEILLEWGWSHPDGTVPNRNYFGQFMNALRVKDKFSVYNSSFSFTDDGQVEITLELLTKGGNQIVSMDVGLTPDIKAKFSAVKDLAKVASQARREIMGQDGMKDILGESIIASISPTKLSDVLQGDSFFSLAEWLNKNATSGDAEGGTIADLANKLKEMQTAGLEAMEATGTVIEKKVTVAYSGGPAADSFQTDKDGATLGAFTGQPSTPTSFARLAALFIGIPIMATNDFDEVQLFFYPFNHLSGRMRNYTIGNFPICRSEWDRAMTRLQGDKVQISIMSWMNMVRTEFFNSMGAIAYGFSSLYVKDPETGAIKTASTGTDLKDARDLVLEETYGEGASLKFRMPKVQMYTECVPHRQSSGAPDGTTASEVGTILRIHFVDEACTSFSTFSDLLKAARSSDMGIVNVTQPADAADGTVTWANVATLQEGDDATQATIFETVTTDAGEYKRIKGGPPAVKYFIKKSMPTIIYGGQNSAVIKANVKSMHNSKMATIHMIRAQKNTSDDQGAVGDQDRGLPMRMMPVQLSMDMFGCPLLSFMQQFFIDFGTGTSVDNIYAVSTLTHKIEPGSFVTSCNFVPCGDAYGQYESMSDKLNEAIAASTEKE